MSDADSDRLDARLTGLANTVEQMDTRLGEVINRIDRLDERMTNRFDRLDERFDRLDGRFDRLDGRFDRLDERFDRLTGLTDDRFNSLAEQIARNRTEMRRELLVIAAVVTAILGGLQVLIAWGVV